MQFQTSFQFFVRDINKLNVFTCGESTEVYIFILVMLFKLLYRKIRCRYSKIIHVMKNVERYALKPSIDCAQAWWLLLFYSIFEKFAQDSPLFYLMVNELQSDKMGLRLRIGNHLWCKRHSTSYFALCIPKHAFEVICWLPPSSPWKWRYDEEELIRTKNNLK